MTGSFILTVAYLTDLLIGDPRRLPHPVRGIGLAIEKTEAMLRRKMQDPENIIEGDRQDSVLGAENDIPEFESPGHARIAGIFLVIIVAGLTYLVSAAVEGMLMNPGLSSWGSLISFLVMVYLVSTTIAVRELIQSARGVIDAVSQGDTASARKKLGMIVGRDTGGMNIKGILMAVIETLSENASDGIIAPLFYYSIGGLPLAMTYKAVNTLDSMVGYKNKKYRDFGWAAARFDDIANYVPARLTGFSIAFAVYIVDLFNRSRAWNSLRIMFRDGHKHSSPNSGVPEAAMAGALGVQLGGPSKYGGTVIEKPYIGEEGSGVRSQESGVKEQVNDDFYLEASVNALSIVKITSLLGLGLALIVLWLRTAIWN